MLEITWLPAVMQGSGVRGEEIITSGGRDHQEFDVGHFKRGKENCSSAEPSALEGDKQVPLLVASVMQRNTA